MHLHTFTSPRAVALLSVLTALCLAVQLSPRPPNVEFTSLFSFVVGFLFGCAFGVLFGGFVMFVNGFFSSWGFAGLNLPFQMLGMSFVGLAGGFCKCYLRGSGSARFFVEAAVFGGFLTVVYDLITNLGVALSYVIVGMHPVLAIVTALGYGAPFSAIHVFSNMAVFGLAFFPLTKALNHVLMVRNLG